MSAWKVSFRHLPRRVLSVAILAVAALAGCGSRGFAPPLGQPARVMVQGVAGVTGDLVLASIRAMHVAIYYKGQAVPTSGARTPAQLRQGGCGGALIAHLTDGNPASAPTSATSAVPSPTLAPASLVTRPDPAGGMDLALDTSADLYVVVLARRDDPTAPVVACGHPLSGRRQYFDLYPPETGDNGIGRGTALMEPTLATRVDPNLTAASAPSGHIYGWGVRAGGCSSPLVAQGTIGVSVPESVRTLFAPLDTGHLWVIITMDGRQVLCRQAKAA